VEVGAPGGFVGERARSGSGLGRGPKRLRYEGVDKVWHEAGGGDSDAHDQGRWEGGGVESGPGWRSNDAVRKRRHGGEEGRRKGRRRRRVKEIRERPQVENVLSGMTK
jgi:hypothetical protein